jgi:two-component system response regulator DevR
MTEPTSDKPIRIFLLDDHEVVRRGLADLLGGTPGFEIVGEAGTVEEARQRIFSVKPDVAVLDGRLPDGSGIDVCRDIRSQLPSTYCLILTSYDDQDAVMAAVLAGASGYVLKEVRGSGLIDAIRQVAMGRTLIDPGVMEKMIKQIRNPAQPDDKLSQLSEREREVLDLIADGLTNRQIAEKLYLAETTVKNYVSSLLAKLGMNRRTQAAVYGADLRRS